MATTRNQPTTGTAQRGPLRWREHKVRRVIFSVGDLSRVVRVLAGGGEYDLKLYLWLVASMQWVPAAFGKDASATVTQTFRALANSIDMPITAPGTLSSRVHKIVGRLAERKLVTTERIPGRGLVIRLLHADGSAGPYRMPDPKGKGGKVYLDAEFFANGWHAVLPKHALALLLVACIEETRQWGTYGANERPGAWREARDVIERKYGIHHDAVDKAKKMLAHYGLLRYEFDELNDDERFLNNAPAHTYLLSKEVWMKRPDEVPRYQVTYSHNVIVEGSTKQLMRLNQPHFVRIKSSDAKVLPMHPEGRR